MSDKRGSLIALDWLNFFIADVETGIGPFVSMYLSAGHHWNPAQIGLVIGSQNIAGFLAQTPAGWLIDRVHGKKWLLAAAAVVISAGALLIVSVPGFALQMVNQVAIGIAAALVAPTIAAISLGLVGRRAFGRRVGRNAAFSHGGNVTTALFAGYLGYLVGQQWIFYASALLGLMVLGSLFFIRDHDIDNDAARELPTESQNPDRVASLSEVFATTKLGMFIAAVAIFHIANAAMLPLAGQELARLIPGKSSLYMSACIVTAQFVMVPVSYFTGRVANPFGRKRLYLFAFLVLALRGTLFALGRNPAYIVGVEAIDGVGTAMATVLEVLIVSDLAKGTGRFNLMLGFVQAGVSVGAFMGNSVGGMVARSHGFPPAFASLAIIAVIGLVFYAAFMPETYVPDVL